VEKAFVEGNVSLCSLDSFKFHRQMNRNNFVMIILLYEKKKKVLETGYRGKNCFSGTLNIPQVHSGIQAGKWKKDVAKLICERM